MATGQRVYSGDLRYVATKGRHLRRRTAVPQNGGFPKVPRLCQCRDALVAGGREEELLDPVTNFDGAEILVADAPEEDVASGSVGLPSDHAEHRAVGRESG